MSRVIVFSFMKSSLQKSREYGDLLRTALGSHLKSVKLFGSRARGDARDDSDYDFLVVVDNRTHAIRDLVLDAGVEMLNKYDQFFGAVLYDDREWQDAKQFPFGWNVENEGLLI